MLQEHSSYDVIVQRQRITLGENKNEFVALNICYWPVNFTRENIFVLAIFRIVNRFQKRVSTKHKMMSYCVYVKHYKISNHVNISVDCIMGEFHNKRVKQGVFEERGIQ